jgi:hypothetical protein
MKAKKAKIPHAQEIRTIDLPRAKQTCKRLSQRPVSVFDESKTDWGVFGGEELVFVITIAIGVIVEKADDGFCRHQL